MVIHYDYENKRINDYDLCDNYTIGEVSVIIATFRECLKAFGYDVKPVEK